MKNRTMKQPNEKRIAALVRDLLVELGEDPAREVDWSQWEKKGIVRVGGLTLDAWHHAGVRDVAARLPREKEAAS